MRKRILIITLVLVMLFSNTVFGMGATYKVEQHKNTIKLTSQNLKENTKVIVRKDGLQYNYVVKGENESFPLQLDKGKYEVLIAEHIKGNKYKVVSKKDIISKKDSDFLSSSHPVYWAEQENTIKKANELVKDKKSTLEKVKAIHKYIVNNISYDYELVKVVKEDYIPEMDKILLNGKGICYDYSSLMAGMLRSQNIPTKLVKGYVKDDEIYHAWNEVLIDGKWLVVDTTYDATYKNNKNKPSIFKNKEKYDIEKYF